MLGLAQEGIYRYGNGLLRKIRRLPLEIVLKNYRVRYLTRSFCVDGLRFLLTLDVQDFGLSRQLLTNDWREYNSTKYLIHNFLEPGDVIIDVGANLGYLAIIEAFHSPENKVYALEPVTETYNLLQINILCNGLSNVQTFNMGISNVTEVRDIWIGACLNQATLVPNRVRFPCANSLRTQSAFFTTLEEFRKAHMSEDPTMIRMDVEGFEYEIIAGNRAFLQKYDLKLCIEFRLNLLGRQKSLELLRLLKSCGYAIDRYILNPEYCAHEAVFPVPRVHSVVRSLTIEDLASEIGEKTDEEIRKGHGCELFLRKAIGP